MNEKLKAPLDGNLYYINGDERIEYFDKFYKLKNHDFLVPEDARLIEDLENNLNI